MTSIALPPEIRAFFDRYRDAFDRLDGDAIAQLYAVPVGIVTGGAYRHWPDFESIRGNMAALCASVVAKRRSQA